MYRHPFTFILMVFLPTILLAIFNLAIFFQDKDLAGRIASLATLLVAYTAFLPTVREQIPPSPKITIFEMCLYAIMSTTVLCLLRSIIDDGTKEGYVYDWSTDPFYLVSMGIVIVVGIMMSLGIIIFKFLEKFRYNDSISERQFSADLKNPEKWYNTIADEYWENHY